MKTTLFWVIAALMVTVVITCSPTEKSTTGADSLATVASDSALVNAPESQSLVSAQKVFWAEGPIYQREWTAPTNPLSIVYNDSSLTADTATFRNVLGADARIISLPDTTRYRNDPQRIIIRFRQSEIALYHYIDQGVGVMQVHNVLIRDKEITLKNGLHLGMSKKDCLGIYPFVTEPSDIIYINEKELGYLRLEFKNNQLEGLEFFGPDWIGGDFGALGAFKRYELYIPIKTPIDTKYFDRVIGKKTTQKIDSSKIVKENSQGYPIEAYQRHYWVTSEESQFELMDYYDDGKQLTFVSAYISTPLVKLTDGLRVGMPREELLNYFELPADLKDGMKVVWINNSGGAMRFVLDDSKVTSIELASGTVGRD